MQAHPPLLEGWVLLHAPRKRVFFKKHASEGRAIKPAPPGGAGSIARPFWRGVGVGVRGGGGSAFINAHPKGYPRPEGEMAGWKETLPAGPLEGGYPRIPAAADGYPPAGADAQMAGKSSRISGCQSTISNWKESLPIDEEAIPHQHEGIPSSQ
ncbi:hypothetical protein PGTUg99_028872 [Puccinia graminis f. sp. tritici]|uniref:Uncharacterized protein n=1 Tax=Puccinia graminis f. sp. tritici TaxID=56615 RepID=A0A5B0RW54_PUCGR|nr:hypothetical protein PGTUg99_036098 [Puccinia graminis f. sp. tritici]KAA1129093.1 hypothetical protein PGTUg99_028872 [Puccinia graminis f. sp. tritici]